jgi:hypothetical protein
MNAIGDSRPSSPTKRGFAILATIIATCMTSGCADEIQTAYGGRTGPAAGPSVNGTAVLANMLEDAGHNIVSRASLSPGLNDTANVIIWCPDDFRVPDAEIVRWLETWLASKSDRSVVYVGRDFDAALEYWQKMSPTAPAPQAAEFKNRADQAQSAFDDARTNVIDGDSCNWFTVKTLARPRRVTTLAGPWSGGIDATKCDVRLYSTYQFNPQDQVLLSDNADTIAARRLFYSLDSWSTGAAPNQLIIVTNGSFLLNLQLVNHEHRKLAAHLINELPPRARVVFLESGPGGPAIRESDEIARTPNGLEVFSIWPLGAVLLHIAALGLVFCFARFPIFGLPRDAEEGSLSDFGKHVTAFGELLHLTRDREYARSRIEHYRQTERKSEGRRTDGGREGRRSREPGTLNLKP